MCAGENGIITQANRSKENTRGGEVKEIVDLAVNTNMTANYTGSGEKETRTEVIQKLYDNKKLTEEEYNKLMGIPEGTTPVNIITIGDIEIDFSGLGTAGKTLLEMFKQAQADGCELTHETCSNKDHLHIGDYLDYKATEGTSTTVDTSKTGYSESQTYTVDANTTWRVIGLNESETELVITTGSPIKKDDDTGEDPYLHLQGAEAYVYCEETLDKICKIYTNSYASEVRSMRIEDINTALGIVKEGNVVYKKNDSSKTNIDQWGVLGQTYTYKSGDYSPESYLNGENATVGDTVTGTAYYYNYTDSNIIDQNSTLWKVLFDGTTSDKNYAKSYWMASPGVAVLPRRYARCVSVVTCDSVSVDVGSSRAVFGPGIVGMGDAGIGYYTFGSDGDVRDGCFSVRPVVSLKSNITESEIAITTGAETDWTIIQQPPAPPA